MSADEESFIVLDETPSMLQFSILDASSLNNESIISKNSLNSSNNLLSNALTNDVQTSSINTSENLSANCITSASNDLSRITLNKNQPITDQSPFLLPQQPVLSEINGRPHSSSTLAQSFLLGAIDCDTMKNNVKCYFPSLSSSTNTEDIEKLQSLIQERNHLKDTLQKTNVTMRQQFSMVNNWHQNVKILKDSHEEELKKFQNINDELFHQNHDLQEKVAELQLLAEYSRKSTVQAEQDKIAADQLEKERLEKEVKDLKKELSFLIASKVESEEIHQENLEKLKIELDASQKLYQNSEDQLYKLKIQNENLERNLKQSKDLIVKYRDEIGAVQAQCEVFRNDFELERKAREQMASERDQMIADMKVLKRRNQALIDEAQSYYTETSAMSLTSLPSSSNNETNEITTFACPLCSSVYQKLNDLESHVQACLETTDNQ